MIENGFLTVQSKENELLFLRPESATLTNILMALLITVISYQATATIIDLVFGVKASGVSKISDVMLSQLMHRSSLTFLHGQFRPRKEKMDVSQIPTFRHPIRLKLLFVLILAPFINIVAILSSLTLHSTLTFSEAGFGGLSFQLHPPSDAENVSFKNISSFCSMANIDFGTHTSSLVDFTRCCEMKDIDFITDGFGNVSIFTFGGKHPGKSQPGLLALVYAPRRSIHIALTIQISPTKDSPPEGLEEIVLVENGFQQKDLDMLMDEAMEMVKNFCGSNDTAEDNTLRNPLYPLRTDKSIRCENSDEEGKTSDWVIQVAQMICLRASFVNSDSLKVTNTEEKPVNLDDFPLLKRTRTFASPLILLMVMLSAVAIRATVKYYTRNDISNGLGLAVREALALPCCDSMLCRKDVILRYEDDQLQ